MQIKTQRLVGQAHAAIEPGKSIPIWKFPQMTGHTGEYLMRTTADYMGIKLTGKLEPCLDKASRCPKEKGETSSQ